MNFTIVTPSFRNSRWLRLCIASVADQQGVTVEQIVQDSCSDDETKDWLPHDPRVKPFIEKDAGMYDAVNRGFQRAQGDILAYLNCDEQYLPGALKQVHDFFATHAEIDVAFADTVVADAAGDYVCHRPALVPKTYSMWVRFPILTCATFVRRSVIQDRGIYFDTQWRDLGDFFWVRRFVTERLKMAALPLLTSVFTDTGENMGQKPNATRERELKWQAAPVWVRSAKYFFILQHRLRLAVRSKARRAPFDFSLYTLASPQKRVTRRAEKPVTFWKGRLTMRAVTDPSYY